VRRLPFDPDASELYTLYVTLDAVVQARLTDVPSAAAVNPDGASGRVCASFVICGLSSEQSR